LSSFALIDPIAVRKATDDSAPSTRVALGMAANLYSQLVTVVTQLASLPIFLSRWSADQYGQWITLAAVPVYLSLSDVGVSTAAGNLMSMHYARGEIREFQLVFNCGLLLTLLIAPVAAALIGLSLFLFSFGLTVEQRQVLFLLTVTILIAEGCRIFDVAYRPFGKYPKVTFLLSTARLIDWVGSILGLLLFGTLLSVALGWLAARVVVTIFMFVLAKQDVPEVEWDVRGTNFRLIKQLARDGFGFLSMTMGSLLTLQGIVILIGSRLLAQISVLSGKSLSPEISKLYGMANHLAAEKLSKRMVRIVMSLTILGALALLPLGRSLLTLWSHGKIPFDMPVFSMLLAAAVTTSY
jgi:O-antigen/teichoic acid export membrane protein